MKKTHVRSLIPLACACLLPAALNAQVATQPSTQPSVQPPVQPIAQPSAQPLDQTTDTPTSGAYNAPLVSSSPALSDPDTVRFRASAGMDHEDNVLRAPSGAEQSDQVGILGVGVKADKRLGLQRVIVDAEANSYRYQDLSALNYTTLNYSAALYWQVGSILEGVLSADRHQFRDVSDSLAGGGGVARRTERKELLEGGYRLGGGWRALAGVSRNSTRSTDPRSWDANTSQRSVRAGASYDFASGSQVAARLRRGDGEYEAGAVSDFRDNEAELAVRWAATAKTSIDGRAAYLQRRHSGASARDFDGLVGNVNANWQATAKTGVVVGVGRDMGSYLFGTGGHVESNRVFAGPVWRATEHIKVSARYEREARRWVDISAGSPDVGRRDNINLGSIGVEWQPRRLVTVSASARTERVSSNLPAASHRANVVGLALKLTI